MMRSAQKIEGGQKQKKVRNSGIELLRILAMLMIVVHHCAYYTPWDWSGGANMNEAFTFFMTCFGKVGAAIFFIISGYFMQSAKSFNWKHIFKTVRPVWFYSWLFLGLAIVIGLVAWSWPLSTDVLKSILPITTDAYWFIGAFLALQLLAPIIRKGLDALSSKQIFALIAIMLGVVIIPKMIGAVFAVNTGNEWIVFPAAFIFAVIGYTIHRFESKIKSIAWAVSGVLLSLMIFIIATIGSMFIDNTIYAELPRDFVWEIYSVPTILLATSLFVIFSKMRFTNRVVNFVAGLMLGVYLIHDNVWVRKYIWDHFDWINPLFHMDSGLLHFAGYCFGMVALVFVGCCVVEAVRQVGVKILIRIMTFMSLTAKNDRKDMV